MPPNELEIFRDLLSTFRQEIHNDIEGLKKKIDDFQKNVSDINIQLGVIQEKEKNFKDSLEKNFAQHDNFYHRLNELEKIPDFTQKTEANENDIIKIKQTAWTAYIIIGIIISAITILSKLKIL